MTEVKHKDNKNIELNTYISNQHSSLKQHEISLQNHNSQKKQLQIQNDQHLSHIQQLQVQKEGLEKANEETMNNLRVQQGKCIDQTLYLKRYLLQIFENERLVRVLQQVVNENNQLQNDKNGLKNMGSQNTALTKQHDLLMKKQVEDENFIKQLQIQQNTDKIYLEQLKSKVKQEQMLNKKEHSEVTSQRTELEKLTADQMKMIEDMNSDLKRTQGGTSEHQIQLLNQQIQTYEIQIRQQGEDNEESQNTYITKIGELLEANEKLNQQVVRNQLQDRQMHQVEDTGLTYKLQMLNQKDLENQTKINRLQGQQQDLLELVKNLTSENKKLQNEYSSKKVQIQDFQNTQQSADYGSYGKTKSNIKPSNQSSKRTIAYSPSPIKKNIKPSQGDNANSQTKRGTSNNSKTTSTSNLKKQKY